MGKSFLGTSRSSIFRADASMHSAALLPCCHILAEFFNICKLTKVLWSAVSHWTFGGCFLSSAMSLNFAHESTVNQSKITWQPEPSQRGTWGILSSCILTTFLCVWTAVHPNVPAIGQNYSQFWRKLYWLCLGLFAPELVTYAAWYQRSIVLKYHKETLVALGQRLSVSWWRRLRRWVATRIGCENRAEQVLSLYIPSQT